MTTPTLSTPSAGREGASIDRAPREHRKGPLAELLASRNYRGSKSVATQANRLDALRVELEDVVEAGTEAGLHDEVAVLLAKVDEVRTAGVALQAGPEVAAMLIEADAADTPSQVRWWQERTPEAARIAIRKTMRGIRAGLEFCRIARTAHPGVELGR